MAADVVLLRCTKHPCDLPWAKIVNGCLVVESRHHGKVHTNQIALPDLLAMMCKPGQLEQILPILYQLGEAIEQ